MQLLRANTEVIVRIGPFVDVGDGFTPQVDITLAGDEAELLKAASVEVDISGRTWAATTGCRGWYDLTLITDDTDTEGTLVVVVQDDSDCLPVFAQFMVMAEAAWDSMFIAKDAGLMDVHVKTVETGIIANASFAADVGSTAYDTNIVALAVAKILDQYNLDHLLKVTTGVAADGDLEAFAVGGTVMAHLMAKSADATDYKASTDSLQGIKDHADTIKADTTTDIPALIATVEGKIDTIDGIVDNILADTGELQADNTPAVIAALDAVVDTVKVDTAAIKVITDALTAAAAAKLALSAGMIVAGTVSHDNTAASTTVLYSNDITEATADHYNGRIIIFTSGALQYQATDITDYELDTGEGKFTYTATTEAPADNTTFIII